MNLHYHSRSTLATLLLSLVLSACGGGGGDGGSATAGSSTPGTTTSTLAPISQANYQTVAAAVVDPMGDLVSVNNTAGAIVTGVEINDTSLSVAGVTAELYRRLHGKGSSLVTGAVFSEACSGGGSVTINETSASDIRITAGDRATITANNCKETNLPTLNGVLNITITSVSGDPIDSNIYSLGIASAFDDFSMTDGADRIALRGDMAVTASQNGTAATNIAISGQSLAFTLSASGTTTNAYQISTYSFNGTESNNTVTLSGRYTVSGSSVSLGGNYSYDVETLTPLVMSGSSDFPSSGSLIVRSSPATVTVTALSSTSVRVDYSAQGNGVTTATNTLSWTAFGALN